MHLIYHRGRVERVPEGGALPAGWWKPNGGKRSTRRIATRFPDNAKPPHLSGWWGGWFNGIEVALTIVRLRSSKQAKRWVRGQAVRRRA